MNLGKVIEEAADLDRQLSGEQTGLSAELFYAVNKEYKIEVDRTFERLRSAELQGNPYAQEDYRRISFQNEQQAAAFQSYMQEHNINAVMPSIRINGQYLVEIPKIVKIKDIQDKTGSSGSDDNLFQIKDKRTEQGAEFLTSTDMLAAYYGDTGENLDDDTHTQTYTDGQYDNNEDYNKARDAHDEVVNYLNSQVRDSLGEFEGIIHAVTGFAERYALYDRERREEKNLFETKEHSEHQRGWDNVYTPRIHSRNKETAVVLNNSIVMINGQIVQDQALRDDILRRHEERMQRAKAGSAVAAGTPTTITSALRNLSGIAPLEAANANVIQAQVYQQEYTVFSRARTDGMLFHGGIMNELTDQINTGNVVSHLRSDYHLSKDEMADTFGRMNDMLKDNDRFSSVQKELLAKINDGLHEGNGDTFNISLSIDDRENLKHMLSNASAKAYVIRGSENNAVQHLQTAMATVSATDALLQLSDTEYQNTVESLKRLAKTKPENLSSPANDLDSMERAVILKLEVNRNAPLSASEEAALQSALAKQSAESTANREFRKKTDEITKLMRFDEQETLLIQAAGTEEVLKKVIAHENARNAYNPDYEPMKIGEMTSGDLRKYTAAEVAAMGISEKEWNNTVAFMENKDKMMGNLKYLKALEKDFGIKISSDEPLTRERILKVNEAFLKRASEKGYQFVRENGTFDVEALKALDKDQLKELGISKETRDMLVKVNTDSEWGFDVKKFTADFSRIFMNVFNKATKDDEEMAKVRQDLNTMKKTFKYTKKSAASVYRAGKAVSMRVSTFRMRHSSGAGTAGNSAVGNGVGSAEKAVNSAQARTVDLEATERYNLGLERKLERVKRDENSVLNRGSRWVQNQKEKIQKGAIDTVRRRGQQISAQLQRNRAGRAVLSAANKVGGVAKSAYAFAGSVNQTITAVKTAAGKYLAIGAAILLLIILLDILFIAAIMAISSLTEADYTDKVAYVLYDTLKTQEDKWLDSLASAEVQFKDKEDKRYGVERISYKYYVEQVANLWLDNDEKLHINPFSDSIIENDYDSNLIYLPEVTKYDGALQSSVGANISMYSRRDTSESGELSFDSGTSSIENGHTSNIKDILAMTDTMYKMDTGGMTDAVLSDIMGVTPATINWANTANTTGTFFKWIGAKIGWYSPDDPEEADRLQHMTLKDAVTGAESGTVSYGAIESYVFALWESSHQEELFLQTEFFPVISADAEINIKSNGGYKNIRSGLKQPQASELGYCVTPVTNKFPVFWHENDYGNIAPYIAVTADDGSKGKLSTAFKGGASESNFNIGVDITNLKEGEELCLWEGMSNDEETWEKVDDSSCWDKNELDVERVTEYFESDWYDSQGEAITDIQNQVEPRRNESRPDEYVLDKNADNDENSYFKKTWYTNPSTVYQNDISWSDREVDNGNYTYHYYFVGYREWIDGDTIYGGDTEEEILSKYNEKWENYDDYPDTLNYTCSIKGWSYCSGHIEERVEAHKKTQYKGSVDAAITDIHRTEYNRNCKGHEFEYCGGHVNIHTQGVVFSATNEQMTMAGVADPAPVALKVGDTDYEDSEVAKGYETLRGKYVDIDYETFAATKTNHVLLPRDDVQGSYIAQQVGLNLWRSDDGSQWVAAGYISDGDASKLLESDLTDASKNESIKRTGIQVADETIDYFIRDIFDVDCTLLKAKNIFPCRSYKDYEGWTADNMQIALMKLSTDWTDMYGFEVPLEIGDKWVDTKDATLFAEGTEHTTSGYTLSQKDVSTVMDLLDKQYGNDMTEERKKAVELTLSFVGKGHYSDYHTAHDFLSKTCEGCMRTTYEDENGEHEVGGAGGSTISGSCTASDNIGFINYIYNASGAYSSYFNYRDSIELDSFGNIKELGSSGDANSAKPCDLLVRRYFEWGTSKGSTYLSVDIKDAEWKDEITQEVLRKYRGADAVIYIGTFSAETLGGDELELSGGQKIHAGVPVTVDLAEIHNIGNIYLHTEKPTEITDLDGDTNYWWVIPENRTGSYYSVFSLPLGNMW